MKHNMGTTDRVIRGIVAVVLAWLVFSKTVSGILAVVLGIVAVAMIVTALFAFCPPYALLGINTCGCGEHGEDTAGKTGE
jgi:hypothetical protein